MSIRERIRQALAMRSYGIMDANGLMFFVKARRVVVKDGRLLFKVRWRTVAIIDVDGWGRVVEGLSLEDFEK